MVKSNTILQSSANSMHVKGCLTLKKKKEQIRKSKASFKLGNIADLTVLQRVHLTKAHYLENPALQAVRAFSAMDYTRARKINIKLR